MGEGRKRGCIFFSCSLEDSGSHVFFLALHAAKRVQSLGRGIIQGFLVSWPREGLIPFWRGWVRGGGRGVMFSGGRVNWQESIQTPNPVVKKNPSDNRPTAFSVKWGGYKSAYYVSLADMTVFSFLYGSTSLICYCFKVQELVEERPHQTPWRGKKHSRH